MEFLWTEMTFCDNKSLWARGAIVSQSECPHSSKRWSFSDPYWMRGWFAFSVPEKYHKLAHSWGHGEGKSSSHMESWVTDLSQYLNSGFRTQDHHWYIKTKVMHRGVGGTMPWGEESKPLEAVRYRKLGPRLSLLGSWTSIRFRFLHTESLPLPSLWTLQRPLIASICFHPYNHPGMLANIIEPIFLKKTLKRMRLDCTSLHRMELGLTSGLEVWDQCFFYHILLPFIQLGRKKTPINFRGSIHSGTSSQWHRRKASDWE